MIDNAEVFLWGTRIGMLHQDSGRGTVAYEYDADFVRSGIQVSPLKMPLNRNVYMFPELTGTSFHGLPGLLYDSLPDRFGNAVIESWLLRQGRNMDSFTPVERLCYTGKRGMGALEYIPSNGPEVDAGRTVDVNEMVRFAAEILSGKDSLNYQLADATMQQMLAFGTSAGGARAKAVIAWNKETGEVRSGQVETPRGFEHWLIKFDGVSGNGDHQVTDEKQYTLVEYAYYLMAGDCGIDMSECRIFEKDECRHFVTKRFDRTDRGKLHMQTFSALLHYDYNIPCLAGYEDLAAAARRIGIPSAGIEQIYRRMVFNEKACNLDDHVKNTSFLMDRSGKWKLAPAYDLTFAYKPGNRWLSGHQMTIHGKSSGLTDADLIQAGRTMGLSGQKCRSILEKIVEVTRGWMDYAERSGVSEERASAIRRNMESRV